MASVSYTAIVADLKGKLSGSVFQKGNQANILRHRVSPFNPRSAAQQKTRQNMAFISLTFRSLSDIYKNKYGRAAVDALGGTNVAALGLARDTLSGLFSNRKQNLPNDTGSYNSPVLTQEKAPVVQDNTSLFNNPDTSTQGPSYTPDHVKATTDAIYNTLHGADLNRYVQNENPNADTGEIQKDMSSLVNAHNDLITGATDPYKWGSESGIPYTAAELSAIEKAGAGIYDPAIEDAKVRFTQAVANKKAQEAAGPDLSSLLANAPDDATKNMITAIYGSDLGTTAQGKRVLDLVKTDPAQAKRLYRQLAYTGLTGTIKQSYNTNQEISSSTDSIIKALDTIGSNNPYKNFWQQNGNFLLQSGDQEYKNLGAMVGAITSAKIHEAYGGALTPGELDRADQYIPNLKTDSLATIKTKMGVLNAYAQLAQDTLIASQYGMPAPSLSDYLPNNKPSTESDIVTFPDGAKYRKTGPNSYEPVAFNSVGGDTKTLATTVNPKGTNRPQKNNNPRYLLICKSFLM